MSQLDQAARLTATFRTHPMDAAQRERADGIRETALDLATLLITSCPESRERSLALTKLEEAVFWAVASIARSGVT